MVIRVLVRLCVDVSLHMGNFEAIVESKIQLFQVQSQDTFDAAKKGYELITTKIDKQSSEVAKVLANSSASFDEMKQEMDAIKVTSQGEFKAMQDAINIMEGEIRDSVGNNAGNWPVGNRQWVQ